MRYLVLSANYSYFLRDEFDSEFHYIDLNLSIDLTKKIEEWHEEYLPIVQLGNDKRTSLNNEIVKLDERGIELAKKIKVHLGENEVKVKYFSEGLLRYIMY